MNKKFKKQDREIRDLHNKIIICKKYKQEIQANTNKINKLLFENKISEQEHKDLIYKYLQGKTQQEWINIYNNHIKTCQQKIHEIEFNKSKFKSITLITLMSFILIFGLIYNGINPITGLTTFEQQTIQAESLSNNWVIVENSEYNNNQAIMSAFIGDKFEYTFNGTSISLITQNRYDFGIIQITIDNTVQEIDLYNNNTQFNIIHELATGLENKQHNLTIEVLENKNNNSESHFVVIDGFIITSPEEPTQQENITNITINQTIFIENTTNITQPTENITNIIQPTQNITNITINQTIHTENITNITLPQENTTTTVENTTNITTPQQNQTNITSQENITIIINETTENITTQINTTIKEEITQGFAEINKPVKWVKKIENTTKTDLPKQAFNISVFKTEKRKGLGIASTKRTKIKKVKINDSGVLKELSAYKYKKKGIGKITGAAIGGEINVFKQFWYWLLSLRNSITGYAVSDVNELVIEENETKFEIEYFTDAPVATENEITYYKKQITISSELHYENILAYTNITETNQNNIKLYHLINNTRELVTNITYIDQNNNNLIDKIQWIVPHLSNESYEIEITILNVQSYPTVGGNWTVMFNTTGKANLTIKAIRDTTWSNSNENHDLKFLEIKCNNTILNYTWTNNSVFIENYTCNQTSYETSKVITSGVHDLLFQFGNQSAEAHNFASINLSNSDASWYGEAPSDVLGHFIMGSGDINNDSFSDLIIGAYANGYGGGTSGKTYLIYGPVNENNVNISNANASWHGEAAGDNSGITVAGVGDVNNDGFGDIVIGASSNDDGGDSSGKIYLIYGPTYDTNINLSNANASWYGESGGDFLGWSLSKAGDVNNDGFDDIIVGANGNDYARNGAGKAYLIYGQDYTGTFNISTANVSWHGEADDKLGDFVSNADDVNNDGFDDILIGAPNNDNGATWTGMIYLVYGPANGVNNNVSTANDSWYGENTLDNACSTVEIAAAGDVKNDGFDDILIGVKVNDDYGNNIGKVYLIYGQNYNTTNVNLSTANASWYGEAAVDRLGDAVTGAGDFNNDGFDDILIASLRNGFGGNLAGRIYLIYGPASGKNMNISNVTNISWYGENQTDGAGKVLSSAGDVDNDGYNDILIASGNDMGGTGAGKVYLIYGSSPFTSPTLTINKNITQVNESYNTIQINWTASHNSPIITALFNITFPNGSLLSNSTLSSGNVSLNLTNLTALGTYTINLWANNTYNLTNVTSDTFSVNDTNPPNITLIIPTNNTKNYTHYNINFYYNVTDVLSNVNNCSLIINNIINLTNITIDQSLSSLHFNQTFTDGQYNWSINCTDNASNIGESNIFNLTVLMDTTSPSVNLDNPTNNFNANQINISLNCSATDNEQLKNVTIYTNMTGSWQANYTGSVSGISNSTNVTLTGLGDGTYLWNCLTYDSAGNNAWNNTNYTFNIDATPPNISLMSPANNSNWTDNTLVVFVYNTTSTDVTNCSLIINNKTYKTNSTITQNQILNFSNIVNNGPNNWSINCTDNFSNTISSKTWIINVNYTKNHTLYKVWDTGTIDLSLASLDIFDYSQDNNKNEIIVGGFGDLFAYYANGTQIWNSTDPVGFIRDIEVFDIGNGFNDTIAVADSTAGFKIYDKDGNKLCNNSYTSSAEQTISVGDFDRDNQSREIVLLNWILPNTFKLKAFNSSCNLLWEYSLTSITTETETGDFDGDGYKDEVALISNGTLYIFNSTGGVRWNTSYLGDATMSLEVFDINNDTDDEIIIGVRYAKTTHMIMAYNGSGTVMWNNTDVSGQIHEIRFDDFDNDGRKDDIASADTDNALAVVIDSEGNTLWSHDFSSGTTVYSLTTGDINNDNRTDIVTTEGTNANIYGIEDGGTIATFTDPTTNIGLIDSDGSIVTADLDGDDYLDIIVAEISGILYLLEARPENNTAPNITLNSPTHNNNISNSTINFNWTVIDNLDLNLLCNLTIDDIVNASSIKSLNNTPNNYTVDNFNDGSHNWSMTCWDYDGNSNTSQTNNFTIDSTPPTITLINPNNNTINYTNTNIDFYYNATDTLSEISNCSLIINNVINQTNTSINKSLSSLHFNLTLTTNNYTWSINCTDNIGNLNTSQTRSLNIIHLNISLNITPNSTNINSIVNVSGKLNFSNGTNIANTNISIFHDGTRLWYNETLRTLVNYETPNSTRTDTNGNYNYNFTTSTTLSTHQIIVNTTFQSLTAETTKNYFISPLCGDGLCNGPELCSTCEADCGACSGGDDGGGGGGGFILPEEDEYNETQQEEVINETQEEPVINETQEQNETTEEETPTEEEPSEQPQPEQEIPQQEPIEEPITPTPEEEEPIEEEPILPSPVKPKNPILYISIPDEIKANQEFEIKIFLDDIKNLNNLEFDLEYDSSYLSLINVEKGSFIRNLDFSYSINELEQETFMSNIQKYVTNTDSYISIQSTGQPSTILSGSGQIATIKFQTLQPGETILNLNKLIFINTSDEKIDTESRDTNIEIIGETTIVIKNNKSINKYTEKELFLISDNNWQKIFTFIPITIWTQDNQINKYPFLIYHKDGNIVDIDSTISFIKDYKPTRITLIEDSPKEFDSLLASAASLYTNKIQKISLNDYFSYWKSYKDIIYVDNDYSLTMMASVYASLKNIPIVIKGTTTDNTNTFNQKNVIAINIKCPENSASCYKIESLVELQKEYIKLTKTDKAILVNPSDINILTKENLIPLKTPNIIQNLYSSASLSAPILASAKHELIIFTNIDQTQQNPYCETDINTQQNFNKIIIDINNNINTLFNYNPKYLTILGSPMAIPDSDFDLCIGK